MEIKVVYENSSNPFVGKVNHHFLLKKWASVVVKLFMVDGSVVTLDDSSFIKQTTNSEFVINLMPFTVVSKKIKTDVQLLKALKFSFKIRLTHKNEHFVLLNIEQFFNVLVDSKSETNDFISYNYKLQAAQWENSNHYSIILNAKTHPLLSLQKLAEHIIVVNALMVDLTELWFFLHKDNPRYSHAFIHFSRRDKVAFKIFGHLAGNPFIWYSIIPTHLKNEATLSPHIFFAPSDNAELQNLDNDENYLFKNDEFLKNDSRSLFNYMLTPVEDTNVSNLVTTGADEDMIKAVRNVVNIRFTDAKKTDITPMHWGIKAGFEKAFYATADVKPKQFLLIPQNISVDIKTAKTIKGVQIFTGNLLKNISATVLKLLFTNTSLLTDPVPQRMISIDDMKLVLSCFSESGFDLWHACENNMKDIKAVIAIEPQNLNVVKNKYDGKTPPLGKDVVPKLLKESIQVYLIGRHGKGQGYHPNIKDLSKIIFLPTDPLKIFKFPPDPDANDFIKYRIKRLMDVNEDPLLRAEEKEILDKFAAKGIMGKDAIKKIFSPTIDKDDNDQVFGTWYSHHFALSGGTIMKLPETGPIYNVPITYTTFFQEAVAKIG